MTPNTPSKLSPKLLNQVILVLILIEVVSGLVLPVLALPGGPHACSHTHRRAGNHSRRGPADRSGCRRGASGGARGRHCGHRRHSGADCPGCHVEGNPQAQPPLIIKSTTGFQPVVFCQIV